MADGSCETRSPPRKRVKTPSPGNNKSSFTSKLVPNASSPVKATETPENKRYLKDVNAVVVEKGLGKTRTSILIKQLLRHGGSHHQSIQKSTTHILVDRTMKMEKLCSILKLKSIPTNVVVVNADWLSACLSEGKVKDCEGFFISSSAPNKNSESECHGSAAVSFSDKVETGTIQTDVENTQNKPSSVLKVDRGTWKPFCTKGAAVSTSNDSDSDYVNSGDEETDSKADTGSGTVSEVSPEVSPEKLKGNWICAQASTNQGNNFNEHITNKLEVLATAYKNTKDQWRALGYRKAISSIKQYHKKIETREECSQLPFVGERLAKKIWEIVETGHLRRLDHIDPKQEAINLFNDVWGAGPTAAETWVSQGLHTLDDLRERGNLTRQQKIGLKYFEEFRERMPREEASKIEAEVKAEALTINDDLECFACGSYRRGKSTCGDVDIIITHPDGRSHKGVMAELLARLKDKGFITDDLALADNGEQRKYLGVCKLPGEETKHRRLDIIVVPYNEFACALMYFTGSDYFNRSMRLLAKKKGMSLTEHSLNTGVVRKGDEKICEGTPLPVHSEKDVFDYLGLEYREPHERAW